MKIEERKPILEGHLHKQSRFLRQWRRRFCMLTETHMLTFADKNYIDSPTEALLLQNCMGVKSADDETSKLNSFRIDYQGSIFYFFCESKGEKDKWIGTISKHYTIFSDK